MKHTQSTWKRVEVAKKLPVPEEQANRLEQIFLELQNQNIELKSKIQEKVRSVLRNICKHKNMDIKNCQVCEAYFQLQI